VQTVDQVIEESHALQALAPEHRRTLAGCASNCVFESGATIMREGDPANAFYIIREGTVALETTVPGRGPVIVQTLHDGELLGWSWLVPPYRTAFDARAITTTHAVALDGACLRGKCDADPALGYDVLKLLSVVFVGRLQDTRLRLLDLYGKDGGG
jgi:CRP-like cAMP-binding protein